MKTETVHATAVAFEGEAVLLRGEPGAGKSSMALELMETSGTGLGNGRLQASLIADDQTVLTIRDGRVWCSAPGALAGLLEVRGIGIITVPVLGPAPLRLVVDLVASRDALRLPEPHEKTTQILGHAIPLLVLDKAGAARASRIRTAFLYH